MGWTVVFFWTSLSCTPPSSSPEHPVKSHIVNTRETRAESMCPTSQHEHPRAQYKKTKQSHEFKGVKYVLQLRMQGTIENCASIRTEHNTTRDLSLPLFGGRLIKTPVSHVLPSLGYLNNETQNRSPPGRSPICLFTRDQQKLHKCRPISMSVFSEYDFNKVSFYVLYLCAVPILSLIHI